MHHRAAPHVAEDFIIPMLGHRDDRADIEIRVVDGAERIVVISAFPRKMKKAKGRMTRHRIAL
jgi:hypothetical protein